MVCNKFILYQQDTPSHCRQTRAKLWAMGAGLFGPAPVAQTSLTKYHGKLRHYHRQSPLDFIAPTSYFLPMLLFGIPSYRVRIAA